LGGKWVLYTERALEKYNNLLDYATTKADVVMTYRYHQTSKRYHLKWLAQKSKDDVPVITSLDASLGGSFDICSIYG